MRENVRPLTRLQQTVLRTIAAPTKGWTATMGAEGLSAGRQWVVMTSSAYVAVAEALSKRGLLVPQGREGRHRYIFASTELGEQVLCAAEFQRGLAIGFKGWCREVDEARARDEALTAEAQRETEEQSFLRYSYSTEARAEDEVHRVLRKNVQVVP